MVSPILSGRIPRGMKCEGGRYFSMNRMREESGENLSA